MLFEELKRFLIRDFLASTDIKVFGRIYTRTYLATMLALHFLHQGYFCLAYHYFLEV